VDLVVDEEDRDVRFRNWRRLRGCGGSAARERAISERQVAGDLNRLAIIL
jgi:hypothetical protein